jgi:hypothetical protein
MATNTSTSNKSFTIEKSIIIQTTFLDNSCDLSLLNNFLMPRVAKSVDFSKAVIFILHT